MRHLDDSEVLDKTMDDRKVLAALDDLVRAVFIHGREGRVSADTLMDVIDQRIESYCNMEVEEEGLAS